MHVPRSSKAMNVKIAAHAGTRKLNKWRIMRIKKGSKMKATKRPVAQPKGTRLCGRKGKQYWPRSVAQPKGTRQRAVLCTEANQIDRFIDVLAVLIRAHIAIGLGIAHDRCHYELFNKLESAEECLRALLTEAAT